MSHSLDAASVYLYLLGNGYAGRNAQGTVYFEGTKIEDGDGNILWEPKITGTVEGTIVDPLVVRSSTVRNIVTLTQSEYDSLETKDPNTEYIITDAVGPANANLSNISASQSAKNEIISWSLPDWDNKISLSTNNVVNTIPCLGYVHLNTRTASPAGTWNMKINDNIVATWFNNNSYGYGGHAFIPVNQGDTTSITAANLGDGATYEFIPMKGAN